MALEAIDASHTFHNIDHSLPPNITCVAARQQWKYSLVFLFHYADYNSAGKWHKSAEYVMKMRCPQDLFLKGRISGTLSLVLLRQNKDLFNAEKKVTESVDLIGSVLGLKSTWIERILRAEIRNRMQLFQAAYEDAMFVINLENRERNTFHDIRHCKSYYHAAYAKYKLGEYQESLELFENFTKNIDNFCKEFLDKDLYKYLFKKDVFVITKA